MSGYDVDHLPDSDFKFWTRRPAIMSANALYLLAAGGLPFLSVLFGLILSGFRISWSELTTTTVISLVYYLPFIGLPVYLYSRKREGVARCMRLNPPSVAMAMLAVLAALVGVMTTLSMGSLWAIALEGMGARIEDTAFPAVESTNDLALMVFVTGVLPGVFEELLFRGFILGAWERRGTMYALVISTLMFASLHGTVIGLPTQIMLGFAIGYLVINSDSVYVGMIYHTVHNAALVLLSYWSPSAAKTSQTLYESAGGAAGVMLMALQMAVYGVIFALLLMASGWYRERQGRPFEQIERIDRSKLEWQALLVLIAGLITVGSQYVLDILSMIQVI